VDGVAMSRGLAVWFGLGGVSADDGLSAHDWQLRLHWVMFGVALLSVPAYLFDTAHFHPAWRTVADALDALIRFKNRIGANALLPVTSLWGAGRYRD
jgi:hypothetical protein